MQNDRKDASSGMIKHMRKQFSVRNFIIGGLLAVVISISIVVFSIGGYLVAFSREAAINPLAVGSFFIKGVLESKNIPPTITFILLGLDKRNDDFEQTLLTDTIIFGKLDTKNGRINLIPLPRDLWINDLKTKVNALYFYGTKQTETQPEGYVIDQLRTITGVNPSYFITVNYLDLAELIDSVGGITIDVPRPFEDKEFPNSSYDSSDTSDSAYMTVRFEKGIQTMNGSEAVMYVRSRNSTDPDESGDQARSSRQLTVFQALMQRITSAQILQNPKSVAKLYTFYKNRIITNISESDLISWGFSMRKVRPVIQTIPIPIVSDRSERPILTHPPISTYGSWVWEPSDPTYTELKAFFTKNL